jgi:hypothetical protein
MIQDVVGDVGHESDDRGDPELDRVWFDVRVVPTDHAGRLELADPLVHRRRA